MTNFDDNFFRSVNDDENILPDMPDNDGFDAVSNEDELNISVEDYLLNTEFDLESEDSITAADEKSSEATEDDKYIGMMLDGRYEIIERIGEGGMAIVYKALCHRLDRYVAVKIMRDDLAADEDVRRRFCAESHAVAMLSHPNIVAVYDVSHNDAVEYIVMELVNGITLKQYMEKKGALNQEEVVHFTKQIADALAHAHERGIIHRDIKPQNIMLLRDGTVKVGDFGIAALENEIHEETGQAIGSIHYIAPEQARGECPDARSDIYSLGVVMYEMLVGEKPYTGETLGEIAVLHMNAKPVPPTEKKPDVPAELERICLKAMCAELEERYQSARELSEDLERFAQPPVVPAQLEDEKAMKAKEKKIKRREKQETREAIRENRRRASKVSFLLGCFGVLMVAIGLFAFLWNFWLGDIFAPAKRINLPDFSGQNYEQLLNDPQYKDMYSFQVMFVVDPEVEPGTVMNQNPASGRSMMVSPSGIEVELTVSSGVTMTPVPDIINMDYREATAMLKQAGFYVEIENVVSDSVAPDYVADVNPGVGEEISTGSIVYITVSVGQTLDYVPMPNLIGLSEEAAITQIEGAGLSYGGAERVSSDVMSGTVISQSVDAGTEVEEHSRITLSVSAGPEG